MLKILFLKIRYSKYYLKLTNNFFLIVIGVVLLVLSFSSPLYLCFLTAYLVYVFKKDKFLLIFLIVLVILITFVYFKLEYRDAYLDDNVTGEVISVKDTQAVIKTKGAKVLVFDYNNYNLAPGDIVEVEGESVKLDGARVKGAFDYKEYLWHKQIDGAIAAEKIKVVGSKFNPGVIRNSVNKYFERNYTDLSLAFIKALILGDSNYLEEDFSASLINNGTIHLFAISGLHITLFIGLLLKLFDFFNIKESTANILIFIFLGFYLIITNFSPSILRASMMYILSVINKNKNLGLSSLDIASVVFLLLVVYNPFYIYNIGFVLSFLVSFIIIIGNSVITGGNIIQIFLISLYAQIATFPIVINLNNEINLLAPIINIVFLLLIETIILPVSIMLVFLPLFQGLYYYLVSVFSYLSIFCADYLSIMLRFRSFSHLDIIIYYLGIILFLSFYNNKHIRRIILSSLFCFTLFLYNYNYFIPYGRVHFLDLYNGEAIIIIEEHRRGVTVIDTGDGSYEEVSSFLKRNGIRKIDSLIITHNHYDHNGEAAVIINQFNVNNIIISAYDNSRLGNLANTTLVKKGSKFKSGNILFNVMHPDKNYRDENDNSIVLYATIGDMKYLFLGDVTKNVEMKFAHLDVDIVKIAHHGSDTSSSSEFISALDPHIAIIQSGRVERFGFPRQNVIDILNKYNIKIYRTDLNYSIKIRYNKKRSIVKALK